MTTDYWDVIEPVWDSLVEWDDIQAFLAAFAATEATARTLFAAHWLYSEVCNGGFHQFYWNSTGIVAPEAVDAFTAIGMPRTAEIIRRTMSWFPTPYPRNRESRIELLDRHAELHQESRDPFSSDDDEFFKVVNSEKGGFEDAANEFATRQS